MFKIKSDFLVNITVSEINEKILGPFLYKSWERNHLVCALQNMNNHLYFPTEGFVMFRMHGHGFITFYNKAAGQENRGNVSLDH